MNHPPLDASRAARLGLTADGAVAAAVIGALTLFAGVPFFALLVLWYTAATLLTRLGRERKRARTVSTLDDEGGRNVWQVLANGGLFAALAVAHRMDPGRGLDLLAVAALAAAAADTWATEIGLLAGGTPRSLVTLRRLEAGTSGGVTIAGLLAAAAGAAFTSLLWTVLSPAAILTSGVLPIHIPTSRLLLESPALIVLPGFFGALADSLIGATVQAERRCTACGALTERQRHSCGGHTEHANGIPWLNNNVVNLLCTIVGVITAYAILYAR